VVARLDRPDRSLRELIDLVGELEGGGVGFRCLKESLDTTTVGRRLIFHVFGVLAEFEREIIRERTMATLEAARVSGRHGGGPRALDDMAKLARRLKAEGDHSVGSSARSRASGGRPFTGISKSVGMGHPLDACVLARRLEGESS
jgi:DNA invertase Pin-like site-specific DNA recombinase